MSSRNRPAQQLQSVSNALAIIKLLSVKSVIGVTEVARELDISVSSAHRLLSTLQQEGFVRQAPGSKKYKFGPLMPKVSSLVSYDDYINAVQSSMKSLSELTKETVHLVALEHDTIRFLAYAPSPQIVSVGSRKNHVLPAHSASSGKILLAQLSPEELLALYPKNILPRLTENTLMSREQLFEDLKLVRKNGYALNFGESEKDITAISVALHDPSGNAFAALSVAAPAFRCPLKVTADGVSIPQFLPFLQQARDEAEQAIMRLYK